MKQLKSLFCISALVLGVAQAGTVPCNGFKINLTNKSHQDLYIVSSQFTGGTGQTTEPNVIEVGKDLTYTVSNTTENGVVSVAIALSSTDNSTKMTTARFNLTNDLLTCKVSNFTNDGVLNTSMSRLPGGIYLKVKE